MAEFDMAHYVKKTKIKVKKEDYRFGIIKSRSVVRKNEEDGTETVRVEYMAICNCGQHIFRHPTMRISTSNAVCDNCQNDFFVEATQYGTPRFTIPYLGNIYRNNRGFKIKRTSLSVIYTGEEIIPVQENISRVIEYDMVDGLLKIWREDEVEYTSEGWERGHRNIVDANTFFFKNLPHEIFWEFISTDVTRDLYKVAKIMGKDSWGQPHRPLEGLRKLANEGNRYLQVLANAGIPDVVRFYNNNYRYGYKATIDSTKTKPHEILGVPKFMMKYVREDTTIDSHVLSKLQKQIKITDAGKMKELLEIVKDEGSMSDLANAMEDIIKVHTDYDYSNLRKLIIYLFRDVKLTQGIERADDAVTYLKDYIRMSKAMELEYEKYPRSLKKVHDVVTLNYNLLTKDKESSEKFTSTTESEEYQQLVFVDKKKNLAIITPTQPEDLVKEGNQLSHCVASYVKAVTENRCKIVFLRELDRIGMPLVTIEVRGANIRQAKGRMNRQVTPEQKEFIKKWAEAKKLIESYY